MTVKAIMPARFYLNLVVPLALVATDMRSRGTTGAAGAAPRSPFADRREPSVMQA